MGSYPRREKAERKARERADTVPVLDCQRCGALTPGERFRYYADQIVCDVCDERNPRSRRCLVPRALLQPMGSGHYPDHTSAVPQEPAQDPLSASLNENGLRRAGDTFQLGRPEKMLRMKNDLLKWDGKVHRQVRFGEAVSIEGTAREAEMRMRRQPSLAGGQIGKLWLLT
jgi:hypothetical protein